MNKDKQSLLSFNLADNSSKGTMTILVFGHTFQHTEDALVGNNCERDLLVVGGS